MRRNNEPPWFFLFLASGIGAIMVCVMAPLDPQARIDWLAWNVFIVIGISFTAIGVLLRQYRGRVPMMLTVTTGAVVAVAVGAVVGLHFRAF